MSLQYQPVVRLKKAGLARVLNGHEGMTFVVDEFIDTIDNCGLLAHVRDYRYPDDHRPFQIWSLGPEQYEVVQ